MSGALNSLVCLRDYTKVFFEKRQKQLEQTYPGLTLRILYRSLEGYGIQRQMALEHLFDQIYIPSSDNLWTQFFKKLELGVPLEYILERAYFYRSEFFVNQHVLIPRSETEILVELALDEIKRLSSSCLDNLYVCDVGTGSGAIILSLMRESKRPLHALATDISETALKVARRNDFNLRFTRSSRSNLDFKKIDRLHGITQKYHLIVSNPPYIPKSWARMDVHSQVHQYEPHSALYLPDEEYENWFSEFFAQVSNLLYLEGAFVMEGHEKCLDKLAQLLKTFDFSHVEIINDLNHCPRFLKAIK